MSCTVHQTRAFQYIFCTLTIGAVHSQSQQTYDKQPFILKELPDHYASGYSSVKIGMCQVYTEEWEIEDNIQRTLSAIDIAAEEGAEIARDLLAISEAGASNQVSW